MTKNPFTPPEAQTWKQHQPVAIFGAKVEAIEKTDGTSDTHYVAAIEPDTFGNPMPAEFTPPADGSVALPQEGDRVIAAYHTNGRAQILGTRYGFDEAVPQADPGERVVGHAGTSATVAFRNDGSVTLTNDAGDTLELQADGTVVVNGGSVAPVTDVSTTKDADGHVTDISLTRASDVLLNQ